jgi:glycerophosphoryl diester phosphodiesterase
MRTIIVIFFIFLPFGLSSRSEESASLRFQKPSGYEGYDEVKQRMTWNSEQLFRGENFHLLTQHPASGFDRIKNSPLFHFGLVFEYEIRKNTLPFLRSSQTYSRNQESKLKKQESKTVFTQIVFNNNKTIAAYLELIQGLALQVYFDDNGQLNHLSFLNHLGRRQIQFDQNEQILKDEFVEHSETNKALLQEHSKLFEDLINFETKIESNADDTVKINYQMKLPNEPKNVLDDFRKIQGYCKAVSEGKSAPLLKNKVFHNHTASIYIYIFYSNKHVAFVGVRELEQYRDIGYFFTFSKENYLTKYIEGDITFNVNAVGREVEETAALPQKGSGLEIKFHESGYPSNYRTIVKERLYGRQIEWNDKGEVISDIDLDIPKPWLDAPKNVENPQSKN